MRKNNLLAVIAVAMAVMMTAAACGSKDNTNTEADQESSAEANAAEATGTEETDAEDEFSDDEGEDAAEATENTSSDAGNLVSGVFVSVSGKYQITPPEGWTIEDDGDESVVAFASPDGSDILEVTYVEGDEADGAREVYPDTMEEYKEYISRGEDIEFVLYNVENTSDGSQTFRYAIRYNDPEDGVRYYAVSGSYNAATKKYISAAGTIESADSGVEDQIEAALDSLTLN